MSIEEVEKLIEEVEPSEFGDGYIDCSTATDYSDEKQYERIIAALKQNVVLQSKNQNIEIEKEQLQKENMELLLKVETLTKIKKETTDVVNNLVHGIQEHLLEIYAGKKNEIRIGDYIFFVRKDHVDFMYEPIQKVEPIKLEIEVVENTSSELCPLCKNELGQYPAISRADNKTKICSKCGMNEALTIWKEHLKNEKQDIQR